MRLTFIICIVSLFYTSCNLINPDEPLPTYVQIDSIKVLDRNGNPMTSNVQGASISIGNSSSIDLLGVFRTPMVIPALIEEAGEIYILPSVEADAIASQVYAYPFYKKVIKPISPKPGDTVKYGVLQTTLVDTFKRFLNDDFEGGSTFTINGADSAASFEIQSDIVSEGTYSGLLTLDAPQKSAFLVSSQLMELSFNSQTYIELDYKCNTNFGISLIYFNSSTNQLEETSIIGLRATSKWNTEYIKIDDDVGYAQSSRFYLAFKLVRDSESTEPARLYLDNVRVNATF